MPEGFENQVSSSASACSGRFWSQRKSGRSTDDAAVDGEVGKWLFGWEEGRSCLTGEYAGSTAVEMREGGAGWVQGVTALSEWNSFLAVIRGMASLSLLVVRGIHLPVPAEARCSTVESTYLITAALKVGHVCLTTVPEWFLLPS